MTHRCMHAGSPASRSSPCASRSARAFYGTGKVLYEQVVVGRSSVGDVNSRLIFRDLGIYKLTGTPCDNI
jgi:hypothetical protein